MGRRQISEQDRIRGKELGKFLQRLRHNAGMSQSELADSARVDLDGLRVLEQGRVAHPSFFTVLSIMKAMSGSLEELETMF